MPGLSLGLGLGLCPPVRGGSSTATAAITTFAVMDATAIDPDAGSVGINGSGWIVRATMPYISGATFDPTKILLTVQDPGYTSSGTTTTRTRYIPGSVVIRQQQPNDANLLATNDGTTLTVYFAIEDVIYQGSTIVGVQAAAGFYGAAQAGSVSSPANNSTRAYPKPGAMWVNLQNERATGSTFAVELYASHYHAMLGQQVACVEFTASDGTNSSATVRAGTPALSDFVTKGQRPEVFKASLSLGALTQAAACTVNARVLPWLGDSSAILDMTSDGAAWPTPLTRTPLRFLNDKNGTYGGANAYVKVGASGGTVSLTASTARAAPFPTIDAALTALATFNNTSSAGHSNLHSDHSGSNIFLMDDGAGGAVDHSLAANIATAAGACWTTIAVDPLATGTVRFVIPVARTMANNCMLRFTCPVAQTASVNFNGGSDLSSMHLAFDGGSIDASGNTAVPINYRVAYMYYRNVTFTGITAINANPFGISQGTRREQIVATTGCVMPSASVDINWFGYSMLGCSLRRVTILEMASTSTAPIAPDWQIIANNLLLDCRSTHTLADTRAKTGLHIVQNVFEGANRPANAIWRLGADGAVAAMDGVFWDYNTIPGEDESVRFNNDYTDVSGAVGVLKRRRIMRSIFGKYNLKTDLFTGASSAATGRVGNKEGYYGVSMWGNVCVLGSSNGQTAPSYVPSSSTGGNWLGEWWPAGNKPASGAGSITYTDNKAGQAGAGIGTYTLTGATNAAYSMVPAGTGGLAYDLAGSLRRTDGTGAAGAYERA